MHNKQPLFFAKQWIAQTTAQLLVEDSSLQRHETEARVRYLFQHVTGTTLEQELLADGLEVTAFQQERLKKGLKRLKAGEPVQYVTGTAYFLGMQLKVTPAALIPRPETEMLVDLMIQRLKKTPKRVLDLCSGCGCIALALKRHFKTSYVQGEDISLEAVLLSKENAVKQNLKVRFIVQDIFQQRTSAKKWDLIVSNPPYIPRACSDDVEDSVKKFEPNNALFVPDDQPLFFYKRLAEIAQKNLSPTGSLAVEIHQSMGPLVLRLFKRYLPSHRLELLCDLSGHPRFVVTNLAEE